MEVIRFFSWETIKILALALLGLAAAKAIRQWTSVRVRSGAQGAFPALTSDDSALSRRPKNLRLALNAVVLGLIVVGARGIGNEIAAEFYLIAANNYLAQSQAARAYGNALSAVQLEPHSLEHWQVLSASKFALHQYASVIADQGTFESLTRGSLDERDAMRFAFADFFLARYDEAVLMATQALKDNRTYPAPYVLLGTVYTAEKRYVDAERAFLQVLQIYPTQEPAVEGLAHVYFLTGDPGRALAVLDETRQFPFSPEARARFEALRALYRAGPTATGELAINGPFAGDCGAWQRSQPINQPSELMRNSPHVR